MSEKVIVDTSIWIDYLKGNSPDEDFISRGLQQDNIYIAGPIISELLQGVRTPKEYESIKTYLDAIPILPCEYEDWVAAGNISFHLRKKGITIALTDIITATIAIRNKALVYTRDKHFAKIDGVKLYH